MDHRIPEPLKALVEQLARLPGLGPKSAMRVAMTLLKWPEAETRRLGKGIHDLRDNLRLCSRCGIAYPAARAPPPSLHASLSIKTGALPAIGGERRRFLKH